MNVSRVDLTETPTKQNDWLQTPSEESCTTKVAIDRGMSCRSGAKLGFSPKELLKGGYARSEVIHSCPHLRTLDACQIMCVPVLLF